MKWPFLIAFALTVILSPRNLVAADDEDYVKIEIKGTFHLLVGRPPGITAKRQDFQLDLQDVVGGTPTEKQLKEWDGKQMIVEGRLELRRDTPPLVYVSRMILYKKPEPSKN